MIINLPHTSIEAINRRLVEAHQANGAAPCRVLTLIVDAGPASPERAIEAANAASAEHPCRVIALSEGTSPGLSGQIRLGGDAGAGEVIVLTHGPELTRHADSLVLPLLLPDAPVVTWWPNEPPEDPSSHPLGAIAQRRITDTTEASNPVAALWHLRDNYQPGDTDLSWTRTTLWRGLLASALDQPPFEPVLSAFAAGETERPSLYLLGAWLAFALECPVSFESEAHAPALSEVRLDRPSGAIQVKRPDGKVATISAPNKPDYHLDLPIRRLRRCLAEELRRTDADEVYGDVLLYGLPKVLGEPHD